MGAQTAVAEDAFVKRNPQTGDLPGAPASSGHQCDASALGAIYDQHSRAVFHLLLARGLSRDEANDLLGEVFLALADRGPRTAEIEDLRAYLFAVARNKLARRIRLARDDAPLDLVDLPAAGDEAEAVAIRDTLGSLPPEQREVVVLKVWHGLTFAEIGAALDIPDNTAASRYRYALQKLRRELGDE